MANELALTLSITGNKAGITSGGVGRGNASLLANMGGNFIAQGSVLANHIANGTITGATNANPIVITTTAAHGLTTGETVTIAGVTGNTNANGTWVVTVLTSTTFSIPAVGNGSYISGGTWRTDPTLIPLGQVTQPHYCWFNNLDATNYIKILSGNGNIGSITNATNASPIVITTALAHGILSGATPQVVIAGIQGNTNANGTFYADELSTTTFSLYTDSGFTKAVAGNGTFTAGTSGYYFLEPVTTIAKLQAGEACIVPVDDLCTLYCAAPVAAAQLEYLIFSL